MVAQPDIKLLDVLRGMGKIIRQIHFRGLRAAEFVHRQLQPVLVIFNARLNLNNVIAIEESRQALRVIPETRLNRSASIAELQAQKRLTFAGRTQLFFTNEKKGRDGSVRRQIRNVGGFHSVGFTAWDRRRRRRRRLLLFLIVVVRRWRNLFDCAGGHGSRIRIPGLHRDVAVFPQRFQIRAQRRPQSFIVEAVLDFVVDFLLRLLPGSIMLSHLQDQKSRLRGNYICRLKPLQRKHGLFDVGGKLAMLEPAQVSALFGRAAVGEMLGKFSKILAVLEALQQVIRLLSQGWYFRFLFPLGAYEDLPQRNLLGTHELGLMFVVILLHLRMIQNNFRPHFVPDHFLLEHLVSDVILEVLERDAAFVDLRLQLLHRGDIVLDANLIQTLDHVGLDVDAHILAALNKQRVIYKVAQNVLIFRRNPLINLFRRALGTILLRFLLHLASRALQVAAGDRVVIYARNHLFHNHALFLCQARERRGQQHYPRADTHILQHLSPLQF